MIHTLPFKIEGITGIDMTNLEDGKLWYKMAFIEESTTATSTLACSPWHYDTTDWMRDNVKISYFDTNIAPIREVKIIKEPAIDELDCNTIDEYLCNYKIKE